MADAQWPLEEVLVAPGAKVTCWAAGLLKAAATLPVL